MNREKHTKILIINGVNLALLGTREVDIYGCVSFDEYLPKLQNQFPDTDIELFQSDSADEIANKITTSNGYDGILLNAGAFTHTSIIIADAVRAVKTPVVEIHISNLFGRENYRKNNVLSAACSGFISGFGLLGYNLGIESILLKKNSDCIKLFKV